MLPRRSNPVNAFSPLPGALAAADLGQAALTLARMAGRYRDAADLRQAATDLLNRAANDLQTREALLAVAARLFPLDQP
jgi:hypothetical protein